MFQLFCLLNTVLEDFSAAVRRKNTSEGYLDPLTKWNVGELPLILICKYIRGIEKEDDSETCLGLHIHVMIEVACHFTYTSLPVDLRLSL